MKKATAIRITPVKPKNVAIAAKPTAAKPRSETEPVEEKANSLTITEPEVPPSTQPLATPDPVPKKETDHNRVGKRRVQHLVALPRRPILSRKKNRPQSVGKRRVASGQPAETSDPVLNKETNAIGGKAEGPATGQPSETSDPVLKKAKVMVAAKMEDPTYAEFVDTKWVMRNNSFGEIICGHVKGKMKSGEATAERPFLYLVKEDEAYIVGGNPNSMAAIVYRAHCTSSNSH